LRLGTVNTPDLAGRPRRPADPDAELLARHVEGDPEAFAHLFRAHADRLWTVAMRLLHDAEEAADAVQDAMLAAHRRASDFRGEAAVATWLHRIVVNASLDRIRRRAARPAGPMPTDQHGVPIDPADPRDAYAERDTRLDVSAALELLAPPMREAVVLVDLEGQSVADAARLLGVPVGTVKSRCARGRAQLAVLLGHLRPGNPAAPDSVSHIREAAHERARAPGEVTGGDD
jgi:RNA polymerase sigma-70 factor (ECF subfamily)